MRFDDSRRLSGLDNRLDNAKGKAAWPRDFPNLSLSSSASRRQPAAVMRWGVALARASHERSP